MAMGRYVHRFDIDDQHSIHIYQGSLAEVQADALVSSDDNQLSAGSGVSAALARVAGEDVRRERLKFCFEKRLRLGNVARTSGGRLSCRYLYHAITIEDFRHYMHEAALRQLVANLLKCATEDGVRTLGMPALGTGTAGFDIARASEIIIEELLSNLIDTPIQQVVLALIGDKAERLFYEQLVRGHAPRCAASSLRRIDKQLAEAPTAPPRASGESPSGEKTLEHSQEVGHGPGPSDLADETGEQFPSLIDETRLAGTPPDQPKLVAGLAALLLKHADSGDIEEELLSRPECSGFRGAVEQRLTEFLYLDERNLRTALGPALFRARDLRRMAEELGEDCELARDPEQLIDLILRALCFNLLAPPIGMVQYVGRVEQLILELDAPDAAAAQRLAAGVEAAKVLEQVLKDLLRLYGLHLFGPGFEQELVKQQIVPARRDGGVARLTLGQARDALVQLEALIKKNAGLREQLGLLRRRKPALLPARFTREQTGQEVDGEQLLQDFIRWRNQELIHDNATARQVPDQRSVREKLQQLRTFLLACRDSGIYPEVLRYEGTFENRNGERFVHFLDERNAERKVRTDEKIDPRRHYYCIASNNPIHLFPVLIPKL
ncbi:MAG TPA: macro domain-containing protein [Gemmataceae bacterium]|nr:macro domain-containing protein [Gemmataceae bacterium]